MARYGGVGGPKNLTPNLRRSKSHVVKKLSDTIDDTDKKQPRLKTSTSCPNVGNQTKKPMVRKSALKLILNKEYVSGATNSTLPSQPERFVCFGVANYFQKCDNCEKAFRKWSQNI